MKIGEFFVELGVISDNKSVRDFAGSLGDMSLHAVEGIAALAGLEYELVKIASDAMNAAVGFEMFRTETGLSWQELQKWQIVGEQVNVSTESISSSITSLQRNLAALRLGQGNRAPFQMLGIDTRGDAFSVLNQIRNRIRALNLDRGTASNMLSQMGLSPDMLRVLELTNSEFAKLSKTITGMTINQEQEFYKSKQALIEFGLVAKQYGIDIVSQLLVDLEDFVRYLKSIPVDMRVLITSIGLLAAAFFPVTAAIVGIILLLDDFAGYMRGDDSLIGRSIEGFRKLGTEIKNAFDIGNFGKIVDLLHLGAGNPVGSVAADAIKGASSIINNFDIHVAGLNSTVGVAEEIIRHISNKLTTTQKQQNNQGH